MNGLVEYLNDEYELNCICFDWIWLIEIDGNLIVQEDLEIFLVAIDCLSRNQDRNEYNYDEKISGRNIDFWSLYRFLVATSIHRSGPRS